MIFNPSFLCSLRWCVKSGARLRGKWRRDIKTPVRLGSLVLQAGTNSGICDAFRLSSPLRELIRYKEREAARDVGAVSWHRLRTRVSWQSRRTGAVDGCGDKSGSPNFRCAAVRSAVVRRAGCNQQPKASLTPARRNKTFNAGRFTAWQRAFLSHP